MLLTRGRSVRLGGHLYRDSIEAAPSGAASAFLGPEARGARRSADERAGPEADSGVAAATALAVHAVTLSLLIRQEAPGEHNPDAPVPQLEGTPSRRAALVSR